MGRGRQKAKQTKVARQLKYYSPDTDYRALERELGHSPVSTGVVDPYSNDDAEDESDDWRASSGR